MSGWTSESGEVTLVPSEHSTNRACQGQPRRVFFGDDSDDESSAAAGERRASQTIAPSVGSRRSQRTRSAELVVDDSDETSPHEDASDKDLTATKAGHTTPAVASARLTVAVKHPCSRDGKADEIAAADVVRRASDSARGDIALAAASDALASHYVRWLVQDFLQKKYPQSILDIFNMETMAPPTSSPGTHAAVEKLHTRLASSATTSASPCVTMLEQTLVAWDATMHHRKLAAPRLRHRDSRGGDTVASARAANLAELSIAPATMTKSQESSGSRRKPQLSVTVGSELVPGETGDYNRLNHPGHTPKAQSALMAAVIGEPGSTPRASASELKALGFDDIDDGVPTTGSLIPTPNKHDVADSSSSSDDDELSKYARRKRAARRHDKHVYIGEAGTTPTKEYVFFRETPPRFVTETVEAAEEALRSIGGNPNARRQQLQATKAERFVELQSSDVAKYTVGQRVENLGAQRTISGLVSKLYGSRQCGMAGPGTVVIDTWSGSDTAPEADEEEVNTRG